ncbi:N-acetyllactosaminide 3-alpha-galactosyltransferase [Teladorsagia circumcincta]|uniref:Hexosyltransferase n=1 Tax=Teladorsagia circumcincta TaxID=45464 RepID=A0A2G9UBF1_TELCI|nr:N-acetyllactosaminide 3-alpha-galactosyltransferase [Teladorsagia circumcincta]
MLNITSDERQHDHWQQEVDRTNLQMKLLYMEKSFRDPYKYGLLFSVGRPNSLSDQKIIEEESLRHGDILQTDFEENYRNITLKHLAELRYLASLCAERVVVVKMDDDVGWDVRQISAFIRNNLTSDDIFCTRFLVFNSFLIDDIFITGVLREGAGVKITNMDVISGVTYSPKDYPVNSAAFLTKKEYIHYWFSVINYDNLSPNQSYAGQIN